MLAFFPDWVIPDYPSPAYLRKLACREHFLSKQPWVSHNRKLFSDFASFHFQILADYLM